MGDFEKAVRRSAGLYDTLANCDPKLKRGQVWCHRCGATQKVDSAACLRSGWPLCCGETMSIDSPEERKPAAAGEGGAR